MSKLLPLIRPHLHDLKGYVSAGSESGKNNESIFLNANENPYPLKGLEGKNRYIVQQPPELIAAYAKTYGVKPEYVIATRGADEAIAVITRTFCEPRTDKTLICPPTFGMYAVATGAMPADVVPIPLIKTDDTFIMDTDNIIENASKIIYLCSPNNPTATSFDYDEIRKIARATEGKSVVVVDETYNEFTDQKSLAHELEDFPNMIVLRTLSKSYSLAGMRMGVFLCADTELTQLVREKILDVYPFAKDAVEAAIMAMSDENRILAKENIRKIIKERNDRKNLLKTLPMIEKIYQSDANFLMIEMQNASEFVKFAAQNHVYIRDFSAHPLTPNCIRLTIGTPEQNDKVFQLLKEFSAQ